MLLDVAAATDGWLAGGELVGDLTEASAIAALQAFIWAQHQHGSFAGEVAFIQAGEEKHEILVKTDKLHN